MTKTVRLQTDAFSAGQIESKIWAAEELEKIAAHIYILKISVLGGWYGLFHFILRTRNKQQIEWCKNYDIDLNACTGANIVNNTWEMQNHSFKSIPKDANELNYNDGTNCVVNTSTEHFDSKDWFDLIPEGTLCLFQGNDLELDDHVQRPTSLAHFKSLWPLHTVLYEGEKRFDFEVGPYTRYMIIGHK
jgi:hypothetical protein